MAAERKRAYINQYKQTEKYKEYNRAYSKNKRRATRIETTRKRLQGHPIDELMDLVRLTCADKGIDYETVKDQYEGLMRFLHDPPSPPSN